MIEASSLAGRTMSANGCRSCGSSDRYSQEVRVSGTYYAGLLPIGPRVFGKAGSFATYEIRVCGACGLVDGFVPERFLPQVKEKFPRAHGF